MQPRSRFHLALVFASVALLLAVVFPLWKPLLVGGVLAAALAPAHDWLSAQLRGRRRLAATILLLGLVLLVLLPLAWVISVAVRETLAGIEFVRGTLQTHGPDALIDRLPGWMGEPIRSVLGTISTSADELAALAAKRGVATAAAVGTALGATAQVVVQAVLLLIAFYFFVLGGRRLVLWIASVTPCRRRRWRWQHSLPALPARCCRRWC